MIKKCKKKSLSVSSLADTQACVFFRGNTHGFGEGFEEIAVVRETAAFEGFHNIAVFVQNPSFSRDLAMLMRRAVMYLLMVVPVADLKIRQI